MRRLRPTPRPRRRCVRTTKPFPAFQFARWFSNTSHFPSAPNRDRNLRHLIGQAHSFTRKLVGCLLHEVGSLFRREAGGNERLLRCLMVFINRRLFTITAADFLAELVPKVF